MSLLRIKDNTPTGKSRFEKIPGIVDQIADKTLEQLEKDGIFIFPEIIKDAEDLTKDQMVLQSVNAFYHSGNVMGFLGCGKERLVIQSRFSSGTDDFFLNYLLEKALNIPNVFNMEVDTDPSSRVLDLLTFLFPRYLQEAMRKGLFKTYQRVSYNDSNPRGTIDIARHIRKNVPFVGKIAYSQREYSYDNYIIELIRHTIEFIKNKAFGRNILNLAKDEVKKVVEATPNYKLYDRKKILAENQNHIIRHAYYYEYRALQKLCILILQNQKQAIGTKENRVYGILFDGAWLWEEYVNTLVKEWFYHPMNKAHKGAEQLFYNGKRKVGRIYPDFIGSDPENPMIADAKYKPMENICSHDYLQLLAYMLRFDAKKGFYLYPEAGNTEDLCLWLNQGFANNTEPRTDTYVMKHGLKIPKDTKDYGEFSAGMQQAETDFKKIFANN